MTCVGRNKKIGGNIPSHTILFSRSATVDNFSVSYTWCNMKCLMYGLSGASPRVRKASSTKYLVHGTTNSVWKERGCANPYNLARKLPGALDDMRGFVPCTILLLLLMFRPVASSGKSNSLGGNAFGCTVVVPPPSLPSICRLIAPLLPSFLVLVTQETESAAPPPSPESIGKGLEHQLLFGEHGNDSYSHSAPSAAPPTTTTAPAGGAASRVQAGFILVKLYCGNSSCSYQPGATTATGTPTAESALLASGDSISDRIAGGTAMVLEGAVKAQLATGAPLMLAFSHFVRWPRVESALAIVAAHWGDTPDAGASRSSRQVIVAGMHGGVSQSLPDHAALLNKGVVLCFDCFGRVEWSAGSDYYPSDEESAVRIAELVRQGFAGQIVISSGVSRRIHLSRLVACCTAVSYRARENSVVSF